MKEFEGLAAEILALRETMRQSPERGDDLETFKEFKTDVVDKFEQWEAKALKMQQLGEEFSGYLDI